MTLIPLREKYRVPKPGSGGVYRGRTGPKCCNEGCGSTRKKGAKAVRRPSD